MVYKCCLHLFAEMYERLNPDQKRVVDTLEASVDASEVDNQANRLFLVYGGAGCGKTFAYNVLYHRLMARGKKVVCASFSASAAILLPNGRTMHSAFGLPVPLKKDSVSRLQPHMQQ
jgi:KaiC/GvpD/RAD55 family RecA-like ATPase